ncbi:MAG: hypothetical protein J6V59_02335 [Alistipes sp.]|nr:hypothetical protein [Alistipes sp.]
MKRFIITLLFASAALISCEKYETIKEADYDFKHNFELFWTLVDEQYCYLDYKNIDWNAVKEEMMPRVEAAQTEQEFFVILSDALDYLRDGHVWMVSPFQQYSCDTYYYDENGVRYPDNFDRSLLRRYMKDNEIYHPMDSALYYAEIEDGDRTYAYILYTGFDAAWSANDFKYIESVVSGADGIIFDIRENPGGDGELGLNIAGQFFNTSELVGYYAAKNGPGHNDHTELQPLYVEPSKKHDWSSKPTMLLINRGVYSTANLVTCALQYAPNVTIIGGKSGGGGAMPMTHYLPNGWLVVFPSNMLFDRDKQHIENGIDPDILMDADLDMVMGKDTIIERAIEELSKK